MLSPAVTFIDMSEINGFFAMAGNLVFQESRLKRKQQQRDTDGSSGCGVSTEGRRLTIYIIYVQGIRLARQRGLGFRFH